MLGTAKPGIGVDEFRQLATAAVEGQYKVIASTAGALEGLLQEGWSLEAAAQRLGYHDASSVSRAARRWFGVTPGQWLADSK